MDLARVIDELLRRRPRFSRAAVYRVALLWGERDLAGVAAAVAATGRELRLDDADEGASAGEEGGSLECYAFSCSLLGLPIPGGGALVLESEQLGPFSAGELADARAAAGVLGEMLAT